MKRWRTACAVALTLQLCALNAARAGEATEPPEARAERRSIAAERAAVETQARTAEADCRRRFAVSGCVAEVQAQRRAALAQLRERELVLDEAKRKAEAQAHAQRLQAKRDEAAARPPPAPQPPLVKLRQPAAPASAAQGGERAARGKKAQPLPVPSAASVAQIASAPAR